jgi:AraC-like DNA-binding protein
MHVFGKNSHIPILGLHEFRKGQLAGREELLFNELHGERHIDKPHQHDFFIMVLFERAQGVHTIDFHDYQIGNRQIHVLFPGQVHKWSIKPNTTGYQLMIESGFFEQFAAYFRFSYTNYRNNPVIPLTGEAFKLLHYEFDAIKNELKMPNSLPAVISARAGVIAAIVSKEAEATFTDFKVFQSNPRLATFNALIDQFYKEQKSVAFYAGQLHISANYLNILCRKHLKISATALIQQRVILEAKRLLQSTDIPVKEIAFELGFVDHAYFSNFFRTQTGFTPTDFRDKK